MSDLIIKGLAAWRLAHLLMYESGPFDCLVSLRKSAGIEHDVEGNPISYSDGVISKLLSCMFCASIWTAIAQFHPVCKRGITEVFAVSAVAIFVNEKING